MRPIATGLQRLLYIYNTNANGAVFGLFQNANVINALFSADDLPDGHGSKVVISASCGGLVYNQNNHIAFNRVGNGFRVWVNGNPGAVVNSSISMATTLYPLYIGARYFSVVGKPIEMYNGYMDNLRITKGVGRFTSAFDPSKLKYG